MMPQHTFLRLPQASPKTATVHTQTSPFLAAFTAMQEDRRPSCSSLQVQRLQLCKVLKMLCVGWLYEKSVWLDTPWPQST